MGGRGGHPLRDGLTSFVKNFDTNERFTPFLQCMWGRGQNNFKSDSNFQKQNFGKSEPVALDSEKFGKGRLFFPAVRTLLDPSTVESMLMYSSLSPGPPVYIVTTL